MSRTARSADGVMVRPRMKFWVLQNPRFYGDSGISRGTIRTVKELGYPDLIAIMTLAGKEQQVAVSRLYRSEERVRHRVERIFTDVEAEAQEMVRIARKQRTKMRRRITQLKKR